MPSEIVKYLLSFIPDDKSFIDYSDDDYLLEKKEEEPSRRLIEFYDDHMILYNKARKDECNIIYYDDIKSWEYKSKVSMDELVIVLQDDSIQKMNAFSKTEFEKKLNKYIKDKKVVNENRSNRLRNSKQQSM